MFRVTFTVQGATVVDRLLQGIEERANDLAPVWPVVVEAFHDIEARVFATEGGSTGAPWPQLAPSTQAERAREGYGPAHPILERTAALKRALTTGQGAYVGTSTRALRYVLGEQVDYFKYHQSTAPRRRLPRRAPVELTAGDRAALMEPIRRYITGRDPRAATRKRVV